MIAYDSHSELNDRIAGIVGCDMIELNAQVQQASVEYEKKKATVELFEHGRKALVSRLIEAYREDMPNASEARLENKARASDEYRDYLQRLRDKRIDLANAQAAYFYLRNHQETVQLQLAFAKSEMYLERS